MSLNYTSLKSFDVDTCDGKVQTVLMPNLFRFPAYLKSERTLHDIAVKS